MKTAICIFATLLLFITRDTQSERYAPSPAVRALQNEEEPVHYDFFLFLKEMEISSYEYFSLMSAYEGSGIYPHYLENNAARYARYHLENPDVSRGTAIALVNINADIEHYTEILEIPAPDSVCLLVNTHYMLPSDWIPTDLSSIGSGRYLRKEAATAFDQMRDAITAEGLDLYVVSAYRTHSAQENLHRNETINSGLLFADRGVARAGHSEHQAGLAVDILHYSHRGKLESADFQDSQQFAWLKENAHSFGFVLRYPEEHADTHGYIYEPWHWRYVGVEIATEMMEEGIILFEEFYGKYLAPDVLQRARELVIEQRSTAEAEMRERFKREAMEMRAAEEALLASKNKGEGSSEKRFVALTSPWTSEDFTQFLNNAFVIAAIILATATSATIIEFRGLRRRER